MGFRSICDQKIFGFCIRAVGSGVVIAAGERTINDAPDGNGPGVRKSDLRVLQQVGETPAGCRVLS